MRETLRTSEVPSAPLTATSYGRRTSLGPGSELGHHEEQARLANMLSDQLFQQAKRDTEYKRTLGHKERMQDYTHLLYERALRITRERDYPLSEGVVHEVARRIADRVTTWQHHPELQRRRGQRSGAARRRRTRGRDAQIIYWADAGQSNRTIAKKLDIAESTVRYVLKRDAEKRVAARMQDQADKVTAVAISHESVRNEP